MTCLEDLPNEILCYIFSFLSSIDLIQTNFSILNKRFNSIIKDIRIDLYRLDCLSRNSFESITQQIYPWKIRSLILSNSIFPDQVKRFFSNINIRKLHELQSLTLIQPNENESMKYLLKLLSLPKLVQLNIEINYRNFDKIILSIQKSNLSQLKLVNTNSSIQMQDLLDLLENCSFLQSITIEIEGILSPGIKINSFQANQLKSFHLISNGFLLDKYFLNNLPNLEYLSFIIRKSFLHPILMGEYLEELLSPLKKLRKFKFLLMQQVYNDIIKEIQASFQTKFWIIDHQWFVNIHQNGEKFIIYTIPYPYSIFEIDLGSNFQTLTTAPIETSTAFKKVQNLHVDINHIVPNNFQWPKYFHIKSFQILNDTDFYLSFLHFAQFLQQSCVLTHLTQLILSEKCSIDHHLYLYLFEQSPSLCILNLWNYDQLLSLTRSFYHKKICSYLKNQIRKLIITQGKMNLNENFFETFTRLQILIIPYDHLEALYKILPTMFQNLNHLILIQWKNRKIFPENFKEDFLIWFMKYTSIQNRFIRCDNHCLTIWNGQPIHSLLFVQNSSS